MEKLYIGYSTDLINLTRMLLRDAGVREQLQQRDGKHVVIKPNLVSPKPAHLGATTHPEIVEGLILFFQKECGVRDITIAEGSWVGASTTQSFEACGYVELARRYGARLVDTKTDRTVKVRHGTTDLRICETFATADFFVNVPVLKGHCQTRMTCCLKNLKGCIPDSEKRRFHQLGLDAPIAALGCALRPDLQVVDGVCGDLDYEEGGNPVEAGRLILGFDPVLVDSYCAGLMGYHPDEIEHLRLAHEWGAGKYYSSMSEIISHGELMKPKSVPPRGHTVQRLARYIEDDSACSPCYAALIHALHKGGHLLPKDTALRIGQGNRGQKFPRDLGIGDCCAGCGTHVSGCPPRATDILRFFEEL